ncbi:cell division protein ZapD [Aliiglaciecola sp. CAU 1673]|uniref:cell division protein ZapD n=1 Tax=Aliiglaciecola sp. CAU 1673 TaxID=3032595 RepID=UPI0023DC82F1|nr:cell division protein ZapD [Aliiglaciecola sp. CAU 1673]MDF2178421.1 cell division protein ZapD [Aliiglaciecola sp. CAU 1673]
MSQAVYEFPLNEKVRTYLRLEQLFKQLHEVSNADQDWQYVRFIESLFTLLDLAERVDVRNDLVKDIELHERHLALWSQHPNIDLEALQVAQSKLQNLKDELKNAKKFGLALKEDKFLMSIRQRFFIPGGTCSFDLPNLHYWLRQEHSFKHQALSRWLGEFALMRNAIEVTLAYLRERGRFEEINAEKGFFQGVADDKNELIRIYCATDKGYYPTLSGNKYRYAIRFMLFNPEEAGQVAMESLVSFKLACC